MHYVWYCFTSTTAVANVIAAYSSGCRSAWLSKYCSKEATSRLLQSEEERLQWLGGLVLFFQTATPPPPLAEDDVTGGSTPSVISPETAAPTAVLSDQLSCSKLNNRHHQQPYDVNFFAPALKTHYEDMLLMYAHFALSSNPNSVVEMVVREKGSFIRRNRQAFSYLATHFADAICVREQNPIWQTSKFKRLMPNSIRFLEVPVVQAKYAYIADTDILLTESVLDPERLQQMRR